MKFVTVLLLFVLTQWSSSMYLPIVPKLSALFVLHQSLFTYSLSLFFVGYAVGQLFWGMLSDFLGRFLTLIAALLLYVIFLLCVASVSNGLWFVVFLSMVGFCVAANTSVGTALIKDLYDLSQFKSIMGFVGVAMACAPAISLVMGPYLFLIAGWQSIFLFLAFVGGLLLLAVYLLFQGNTNIAKPASSEHTISLWFMLRETLRDRVFGSYLLALSMVFGVFFSMLLAAPFILIHQGHFSVKAVGYLTSGFAVAALFGALFNAYFSNKMRTCLILTIGLFVILLGATGLLFNFYFLEGLISQGSFFAACVVMLGIGITLPAAKTGAMVSRKQHIGTAAALMKFFQSMGAVFITKLTSYFINENAISHVVVMLFMVVLLVFLFISFFSPLMKNLSSGPRSG